MSGVIMSLLRFDDMTESETMAPPQGETTTTPSSMTATEHGSAAAVEKAYVATDLTAQEADSAIQSFCNLIAFPTVSATAPTDGSYTRCAAYLVEQLQSVACLDEVHVLPEAPEHSPVVVARWKGADETLPVILLNSHYDVVPADPADWTIDPFAALRKGGKVYGRGAQDMKCVCIQYIEAIRKLSTSQPDFRPARSIYLSFVPDEEVGGSGMACLLDSALYRERMPRIAVALDEGLASTTDVYSVFYGERLPWWVSVKATGNTGHGSRFIESTAVEQIIEISKRALEFRRGQRAALHGDFLTSDHSNCSHAVAAKRRRLAKDQENKPMTMGDVTSLNITTIEAGVRVADTYAYNCVPPIAKCSFDIRISPHVEPQEMKDLLDTWCRECSADAPSGHNLEWCLMDGQTGSEMQKHALTSIDSKINPWYGVFTHAMSNMGKNISPEVFPAATDSRFLRALGIRALGFSPMRNTQVMLHENDEYLEEDIFVEGIGVYVGLIQALASQGKQPDE